MQRDKTRELIDAARHLLKPTPVVNGRIPLWLTPRLRAAHRAKQFETIEELRAWASPDSATLLVSAAAECGLVLDHWGATSIAGEDYFVSEPYEFTEDAMAGVIRFASMLSLGYRIDPNSWHYPGRTIRILFGEWPSDVARQGPGRLNSTDTD